MIVVMTLSRLQADLF